MGTRATTRYLLWRRSGVSDPAQGRKLTDRRSRPVTVQPLGRASHDIGALPSQLNRACQHCAMGFTVMPVAVVREGRPTAQDDFWGGTLCRIELDPAYDADSLAGLDDFSHLEVVYLFDRVDPSTVETTARHPRNREDWPLVGIFGQRGKRRPNRLGVSRCGLVRVEDRAVVVTGLDAIEGTPVLDIKPWMAEFGPRGDVQQPRWASELMADYYRPEAQR